MGCGEDSGEDSHNKSKIHFLISSLFQESNVAWKRSTSLHIISLAYSISGQGYLANLPLVKMINTRSVAYHLNITQYIAQSMINKDILCLPE